MILPIDINTTPICMHLWIINYIYFPDYVDDKWSCLKDSEKHMAKNNNHSEPHRPETITADIAIYTVSSLLSMCVFIHWCIDFALLNVLFVSKWFIIERKNVYFFSGPQRILNIL